MPVNVFVAYVDTYIGTQLLRQFEASPHLFTVHGCTWTTEAATALNEQLAADDRCNFLDLDATCVSSLSDAATTAAGMARDHNDSLATLRPGAAAPATGSHAGTVALSDDGGIRFFSRHDAAAVRRALAACEWIVVEQRQSQEVLDLLACVQQSLFDRPKKFVLISSFMTWYATPPLTAPEDDDNDGGGGGYNNDEEGEAPAGFLAEDTDQDGTDGVGADVRAPYPPPPEHTSDADEDGDEDADADAEGDAGGEVLTEDQYNRRVAHVRYYNWRDAEKAVAAAHRARGLPLDTYVVFAGLAYGEGEDLLEPFFRQAWAGRCADPATAPPSRLPVYGTGAQRVPMIHVRDLATFARKLLHRPAAAVPSRYIFATDGARPTWRGVVASVNRVFGGQCGLVPVPPAEFPLHTGVEQFTVNLRVERGAMAALLVDMVPDPAEGDLPPADAATAASGGDSLWAAEEGGFVRHIATVAHKFCEARGVTPLRLVVQGPPAAGKRFAAARLGAHYRLPNFSIEDVVDQYKAALVAKQATLEAFRVSLMDGELARRQDIKKRRVLNAIRTGRGHDNDDDENNDDDGGEGGPAPPVAVEEESSKTRSRGSTINARKGAGGRSTAAGGNEAAKASIVTAAAVAPAAPGEDEGAEEPAASAFDLTPAEVQEAAELMEGVFEGSARVARWRDEIAEMERVLLMRLRVDPLAAGGGGGPSAAGDDGGASSPGSAGGPVKKRAVLAGKSKKLTKEQQRRREEEELQLAKEALKDAPFQDRALAIMLRWRLDAADCRTQGYVLHGFPQTVAQARLTFGVDPLPIPRTEEEALNPPPEQEDDDGTAGGGDNDGEEDGAEPDPLAGLTREPCDERRLPDFALVFQASDNFLLDRIAALSELKHSLAQDEEAGKEREKEESAASATMATVSSPSHSQSATEAHNHNQHHRDRHYHTAAGVYARSRPDLLRHFNDGSRVFREQFMGAPYSMLSYWECAVTDRDGAGVTPGGRSAAVRLLRVDEGGEPAVPPAPPASPHVVVDPTPVEIAVRDIAGAPHYFGRTPLELHQEAVRRAKLAAEREVATLRERQEVRDRNAAAHDAEVELTEAVDAALLHVKAMDLASLEARKEPLRGYLMESVIPLISKGLLEVAARRPENPLEYLSEWLIRHNPNSDVFVDL